jgi:hypothetical protein
MKIRNRTSKLLTVILALGMIAAICAIWGARTAEAIIIVNSKTGTFTLTTGEAVRVYVANTGGQEGIIVVDGIVKDVRGDILARFTQQRVPGGHSGAFMFDPQLADGDQLPVRIELRVSGESIRRGGLKFIPTCEVFDTATGRTSIGQDFIIDDGDLTGIIDDGK